MKIFVLSGVLLLAASCPIQVPVPSPSPVQSPSPVASPTPTPVSLCAVVLCPPGTVCMVQETVPSKVACVPLSSPSPTPSPSAPPVPSPSPSPSSNDACVADGLKIAFRAMVPKWNDCRDCRGARNTFDVTPTRGGVPIGPESNCGQTLIDRYGEFDGVIVEPGNVRSGFEHQSDNSYIFVHATNSDDNPEHWRGKQYLAGGPADFCVSWHHLTAYRCQHCVTDSRGAITRSNTCGTNAAGFDLPK